MKTLLLILFALVSTISIGQNIHFIKSYGNNGFDFGRDIKQDLDTGYIATGSSSSFSSGNADAFLLKVDSLGNFKWSYNYGGSGSDWGEAVVTSATGGYALAGYTNSFGAGGFDFYFVKANGQGMPEYEKTYGGPDWDKAYDMVQLPDSGYVMVGETFSYGEGNNDIYVVRINALGDTLWTRTYGGPEADYANAVLYDGDSIVVVGGTKSFGNGMTDGIILKYHINGTLGWVKTAGMEKDDYFTGIARHSQTGHYAISGTRDYNHFQNCDCGNDFWIYKIEPNGVTAVDTSRAGTDQVGFDIAFDIEIGSANNTFFSGSTTSWGTPDIAQGFSDAFVGKFQTTYAPTNYVKNFGTTKSDIAYAMDNTFDDGMIVIGDMFHLSSGGYNLFILKVDKLNSSGQITVINELSNDVITLGLEDDFNMPYLKVYPTIVHNTLQIDNLPEESFLEVVNLNGQQVFNIKNPSSTIDLEKLEPGFYLLNVIIDQNEYAFKFIKR